MAHALSAMAHALSATALALSTTALASSATAPASSATAPAVSVADYFARVFFTAHSGYSPNVISVGTPQGRRA